MTDNEIIKALFACSIKGNCPPDCPYQSIKDTGIDGCFSAVCGDALELIQKQQEKLKIQANNIHALLKMKDVELQRIKAEAIKEFADRIVEYIDVGHLRPATEICFSELDVQHIVEKIAKEMAGAE